MIKFLIGFNAAPGQSRALSQQHYRERHAPLVRSVDAFWRHVGGYVQNLALDDTPSALDGVSELWFDDWRRYDTAFAEPLYLEHIRPDEQRFADFASLLVVFAHDVTVFGGGAVPPYKLLRFLSRAPGLAAEDFRAAWEGGAAAVAADPFVRRFASGYVQNRPLTREDLAFAPSDTIDGVDEFWFADLADLHGFLAAGQGHDPDLVGSVVQVAAAARAIA